MKEPSATSGQEIWFVRVLSYVSSLVLEVLIVILKKIQLQFLNCDESEIGNLTKNRRIMLSEGETVLPPH